jgi:hypothetical protein
LQTDWVMLFVESSGTDGRTDVDRTPRMTASLS